METSNSSNDGHGAVGKNERVFTKLKDLRTLGYDPHKLAILADAMRLSSGDAADDGPDAEENLYMPAGYTYLGQFADHDLTFDTTSSLDGPEAGTPTNLRSPRFDLDCLYGGGPADQPYMYDGDDKASLLWGGLGPDTPLDTPWDLLRAPNGRAIIGDKRNDENSIINQIQRLFVHFHNRVVRELKVTRKISGDALFKQARDEVRWAYQRVLVDDFLPRIIDDSVLRPFVQALNCPGSNAYRWYTADKRSNLPREFVAAAYRFGHSGVRTGYRLNQRFAKMIFDGRDDARDSLVGFDPLPESHVIDDWARFFPDDSMLPGQGPTSNVGKRTKAKNGGDGAMRLQYAYKLDATLVDPLTELPPKIASADDVPTSVGEEFKVRARPALAMLNLLRGNIYRIQSGQAFAADLGADVALDEKYLVVRRKVNGSDDFEYAPISELIDASGRAIDDEFKADTPLWFYILAEAQRPLVDLWRQRKSDGLAFGDHELLGDPPATGPAKPGTTPNVGAGTRLGPVGGRIVAEVFYGLLQADDESFIRAAPKNWAPIWGGSGPATMAELIAYAGQPFHPAS